MSGLSLACWPLPYGHTEGARSAWSPEPESSGLTCLASLVVFLIRVKDKENAGPHCGASVLEVAIQHDLVKPFKVFCRKGDGLRFHFKLLAGINKIYHARNLYC
jgi:hypothetical protein